MNSVKYANIAMHHIDGTSLSELHSTEKNLVIVLVLENMLNNVMEIVESWNISSLRHFI